jgi:CheY-like chemotaxis protein
VTFRASRQTSSAASRLLIHELACLRHHTMTRSRRVLLIDDNLDAAESLAQLLALSGHDARTAGDGVRALRLAQEFQPEVVFCDLGLPGMNGYEVARELRALPFGRAMVLAALTGYGQPGDREKTARAGFDAHLVKPVDPAVIESFLEDDGER